MVDTVNPPPVPTAPTPQADGFSYKSEDISRYLTTGSLDQPAPLAGEAEAKAEQAEDQELDQELEQEAKPEGEELVEEQEELINKKTFQKRLAKEVSKTKAWKERFEQVTQQHQAQVQELTQQLHQAVAIIKTVMENEDKIGSVQTEDQEKLLQYQMKENLQAHMQKMQQEYQQQLAQAQHEAKVNAVAEQIHQEVVAATSEYPLAHYQDIMHYAQVYPNASIKSIAKKLHERLATKVAPSQQAPKPLQSSSSFSYSYDPNDVAAFLRNNQ